MSYVVRIRWSILLLALVCALSGVAPLRAQSPADVAVVVHRVVPVDNLSLADLRRILLGDREFWPASLRMTLLVGAPGTLHRAVVLTEVCQMTDDQFRQHWIAKVFRADTAVRPRIIYTDEEAVSIASQTPGAIAFVDPAKAKHLKIVKLDGKLPGQKGYPLH
jgi:ABC-type phosphate transport system substrate-binding protein